MVSFNLCWRRHFFGLLTDPFCNGSDIINISRFILIATLVVIQFLLTGCDSDEVSQECIEFCEQAYLCGVDHDFVEEGCDEACGPDGTFAYEQLWECTEYDCGSQFDQCVFDVGVDLMEQAGEHLQEVLDELR